MYDEFVLVNSVMVQCSLCCFSTVCSGSEYTMVHCPAGTCVFFFRFWNFLLLFWDYKTIISLPSVSSPKSLPYTPPFFLWNSCLLTQLLLNEYILHVYAYIFLHTTFSSLQCYLYTCWKGWPFDMQKPNWVFFLGEDYFSHSAFLRGLSSCVSGWGLVGFSLSTLALSIVVIVVQLVFRSSCLHV